MSFKITYKTLFEVQILHNYFLSKGNSAFNQMNPENKEDQLKLYNIDEFLTINPSLETISLMKGHKLHFKTTKNGLAIYCKTSSEDERIPFVDLSPSLQLTFILKLKDPYFGNYTELEFSEKETLYFGNSKLDTESNQFKYIHLKSSTGLIDNRFKISTSGAKQIKSTLTEAETRGLFGVIQLSMNADKASLNILANNRKIRKNPKTFKIHFNNRKTFWRYVNTSNNSTVFTTSQKQPLTKYGYIEVEDNNSNSYPNPSVSNLIIENSKFISETYINQ